MEEAARKPNLQTTLPWDRAREALSYVGIDLPENPPPQTVLAAYQALESMPSELLGPLINQGMTTSVSLPVLGRGAGGFISPLRAGVDVQFEGTAKLSDIEIGSGLQATQRFETTAEMQTGVGAGYGRTTVNGVYKWLDRFDALPGPVKELVERSPVANAVLKGLPVPSVEARTYVGSRLTYEAVVTPEQGARLAAGDMSAMPNPFDPLNMPAGSSVMIRGQNLEGTDFEASYRRLNVGGSVVRLEGAGFGVRRLEGNLVEVYAGPISTIENSSYLGYGPRKYTSVQANFGDTAEEQKLSVARLDLGTPEGQDAYRQFMAGGGVPLQKGPGIPQVGHSNEYTLEQARSLGITLGNNFIGLDNDTNNSITLSNLRDGSEEITYTYRRNDGLVTQFTAPFDEAKRMGDAERGTYSVVLPQVPAQAANGLRHAYGASFDSPEGLGATQAVELKFSAQDLMRLRDLSREYMQTHTSGLDAEQVKAAYARLDAGGSRTDGGLPANGEIMTRIASARTPGEVLNAFQMYDNKEAVPLQLSALYGSVPGRDRPALPGELSIAPPQEQIDKLKSMSAAEREAHLAEYYRFPTPTGATRGIDAASRHGAVAPAAADPKTATADSPSAVRSDRETVVAAPATLDRDLDQKIRESVRELDRQAGKQWDERSERLAASAYTLAVEKKFSGDDTVKLAVAPSGKDAGGAVLHVYREGRGASPDPTANHGHIAVAEALAVPSQERYKQAEAQRQGGSEPARAAASPTQAAEEPARTAQAR